MWKHHGPGAGRGEALTLPGGVPGPGLGPQLASTPFTCQLPTTCARPEIEVLDGVVTVDATQFGAMGSVFSLLAVVDPVTLKVGNFREPFDLWRCGASVGLQRDDGTGNGPIDHRQGPVQNARPLTGVPAVLYETLIETIEPALAGRVVEIDWAEGTLTLYPPPASLAGKSVWVTPDDRPSIQDALYAVRDGMADMGIPAGEVYLPGGTYQLGVSWADPKVNRPLLVPSGVTLNGEGKEQTTLLMAPEILQDVVFGLNDQEIRDYNGKNKTDLKAWGSGWFVGIANELASTLPFNIVHPNATAAPTANGPAGPGVNKPVAKPRDGFVSITNLTIDMNKENQSFFYTGASAGVGKPGIGSSTHADPSLWENGGIDSLNGAIVLRLDPDSKYPDPPVPNTLMATPTDAPKVEGTLHHWESQLSAGHYVFAVSICSTDAPDVESTVTWYRQGVRLVFGHRFPNAASGKGLGAEPVGGQ